MHTKLCAQPKHFAHRHWAISPFVNPSAVRFATIYAAFVTFDYISKPFYMQAHTRVFISLNVLKLLGFYFASEINAVNFLPVSIKLAIFVAIQGLEI